MFKTTKMITGNDVTEEESNLLANPMDSNQASWSNSKCIAPTSSFQGQSRHQRSCSILRSFHLYYWITITLFLGLYVNSKFNKDKEHPQLYLPQSQASNYPPFCGSTSDEAVRIGCGFDFYAL
jgi:hypothetical protein